MIFITFFQKERAIPPLFDFCKICGHIFDEFIYRIITGAFYFLQMTIDNMFQAISFGTRSPLRNPDRGWRKIHFFGDITEIDRAFAVEHER